MAFQWSEERNAVSHASEGRVAIGSREVTGEDEASREGKRLERGAVVEW